jgi:DNA-binding transcriptional LysR family regulator
VDELALHDFIVLVTAHGPLNELHFEKEGRRQRYVIPMERAWETNDGALARAWALGGKGIARKTIWDAINDVRAGALELVLADRCVPEAGVHAVFHGSRYMPPRVRALLDFLVERFAQAAENLTTAGNGASAADSPQIR